MNTSACPTAEKLREFLDEQLDAAETERLLAHVGGCPACRQALEELTAEAGTLGARLRPPPADDATPLPDFTPKEASRPAGRPSRPEPAGGAGAAPEGGEPESGAERPGEPAASGDVAVLGRTRAWPEVDGYEILGVLGRGGEAVVYKARHRALGRLVALKMIRGADAADPAQLRRFRREAALLARLSHPHIVQIYEVGVHADLPFFALEYLDGGTLAERLTGQPLPARFAAAFVATLARAVQAAHQAGVIHRDLKPANVLLQTADAEAARRAPTAGGLQTAVPKISDFGLGKQLRAADSVTSTGAVMGTPAYMAPEQAQGRGREAGPACDVYALGAILYQLLTGRPPFVGARSMDVLLQVVHDEPLPPRRLWPRVPRDLETVCLKCLHKEPAKRYAGAGDLADDLTRYLKGEPVRARRAGVPERGLRWARRRPGAAALVGACVLLLALAGAGAVWYQHDRAEQTQRRQEVDQAVALALGKAQVLREQARLGDEAKLREALAVSENAAELARTGGASAGVRRQAEALRERLRGEVEAAGADRRLLATLLEAHTPHAGSPFRAEDKSSLVLVEPGADEQFAAAFRAWGLDVDATPTDEAARRLGARPPAVVTEVVAALSTWAAVRSRQGMPAAQRQHLVDLVQTLGATAPGSRQAQVHAILGRGQLPVERALGMLAVALRPVPVPYDAGPGADHARLRQLAEQLDLDEEPVLGVLALVRAFHLDGDAPAAERLLRAAVRARPTEVVFYTSLGAFLEGQRPPRWAEAAECYAAARALRPELGVALARSLVKSGRVSDGLALYERLTAEKPNDPWFLLQQGNVLVELGHPREARARFDAAIRLKPDYADAYSNLGAAFYAEGNTDEAIRCFGTALTMDPKNAHAYTNLGVALKVKGRLDEAIDYHHTALALEPRDASVHVNLGNAFEVKELWDEATACYRTAIELDPKNFTAHWKLGYTHYKQGQLDKAVSYFRAALALNATVAGVHSNLGNVFRAKREPDEALSCFRTAIALEPANPGFHLNLGNAYQDKGQLDEALRCYRAAVALDPRYALAHFNLADAYREKGQLDEAIDCYRQAITFDAKDFGFYLHLGNTLHLKGRPDEAIDCFRQAIALNPEDARPHNNLGYALEGRGRLDEAIRCYQKAIALDPRDATSRNSLGSALQRKGQLDEACEWFRKAIDLDPKYAPPRFNLGNILQMKGRLDEAADCLRRAVEIAPSYAPAHSTLGRVEMRRRRFREAAAAFREAVRRGYDDPQAHYDLAKALSAQARHQEAAAAYREVIRRRHDFPAAHCDLGQALATAGRTREAEAAFRESIRLKQNLPAAYCNLGHVLREQGRYAEALAALRLGHQLGSQIPGWRHPSAEWVRQCERFAELDPKLSAILKGDVPAANATEMVDVAVLCCEPSVRLYRVAVQFYRDAFAADPQLAANLGLMHRYNAACAAARASGAQGEDARNVPDKVALMLRREALAWLRADLDSYARLAERDAAAKPVVGQWLTHWRRDPDLAGLRDQDALARLPDAERAAWLQLWADVDALLKQSQASK